MSLCINNDLIWIAIPKCASKSIEKAFINSDLDINHYIYGNIKNDREYLHMHADVEELYNNFGIKETISVKRNFFERWLSGFEYFLTKCEELEIKTKIRWEEIDNDFIYKEFSKEYINYINTGIDFTLRDRINSKFVENSYLKKTNFCIGNMLLSQNYWIKTEKCTYEFDINELNKFEEFIKKRYNKNIHIEHLNKSKNKETKIIKNDELKNWVYDNFEKPFIKRSRLI